MMLERETEPLIPSPGRSECDPKVAGRAVEQLSIDSTAAVAECVCVWTSKKRNSEEAAPAAAATTAAAQWMR